MKLSLISTAMAVLATTATALPATASPAHLALQRRATTCSTAATDKLLFQASMQTFQKARQATNPKKCDWSSDKCSWSPDRPRGYDFVPSCERHDFGYRNTKAQKRFTKAMKARLDENFQKDLYRYCAQFLISNMWKSADCRHMADMYVFFVRMFGKRDVPVDAVEDAFENSVFDIELDDDIEGQEIPEINENGQDVDDLDAWFGSGEE